MTLVAMTAFALYLGVRSWESQRIARIDTRFVPGRHLLYVVAPDISPPSSFTDLVGDGRDSVRAAAAREGMHFGTIGVSFDWRIRQGTKVLSQLGPFDEFIVGRNWLNEGIAKFMTGMQARLSVPQVMVFEQDLDIYESTIRYGPLYERLRLRGLEEITAWARSGYSLPPLSDSRLNPAIEVPNAEIH